uniref:BTB/POZ domain-containing protein At2g04740 n=1 Tax=Anthurium amnicola TaxID=1678845 RepID=A0A1D1XP09_9ARAE
MVAVVRESQVWLHKLTCYSASDDTSDFSYFPPDVTFFVGGRPIEAHRLILSARSPFFKRKFETEWKDRSEVRFARGKLSYPAFYSLVHFFYSDRLDIAVDDMDDLIRLCKACKCDELQKVIENELRHQKNAEYKALRDVDNSQKRFILQGFSLPEEDRLPSAMHRVLQVSLANSRTENVNPDETTYEIQKMQFREDLADVCVKLDKRVFRCHQVIVASRSEYFKARLSRMTGFLEGEGGFSHMSLPFLEEHDLSSEAFEKMIEYMYTDALKEIDPDQAEELFDAASRYLLFPLKRAVADALLPHLELASPAELCHWLLLSDMYGILKIREYCLDTMACNFETFADTREFRALLLTLPPPSGDSSLRTTRPSAPGSGDNSDQGNLLDDLREKWLEAEAAELDKRDESASQFDRRLEMLILVAEQEVNVNEGHDIDD